MRNRDSFRLLCCAGLLAILAAPLQVSGQWMGPGCMVANMMGFGGFSGGIRFSAGSNGFTPGSTYPGFVPPHLAHYPAPLPPTARFHGEPTRTGSHARLAPEALPSGRHGFTWSADNVETGPYRELPEESRAWNLWR